MLGVLTALAGVGLAASSGLLISRAALRPGTRMLIAETIANPTTKVADIGALAQIAADADALLLVDATFTPPTLYRPLADGADLVVHSLTKYINGHGDAMGGAVLGRSELMSQIREQAMVDVGGVISPFNAWLIARGAMADVAGGPAPKLKHRFFHVPASNTAVGHLILEN